MADHFVDNEAEELFGEFGIKSGVCGQLAQSGNLPFFASRISGGELGLGLVAPDRLRDFEPLGEHVDERGIDIVDARAELGEGVVGHSSHLRRCDRNCKRAGSPAIFQHGRKKNKK